MPSAAIAEVAFETVGAFAGRQAFSHPGAAGQSFLGTLSGVLGDPIDNEQVSPGRGVAAGAAPAVPGQPADGGRVVPAAGKPPQTAPAPVATAGAAVNDAPVLPSGENPAGPVGKRPVAEARRELCDAPQKQSSEKKPDDATAAQLAQPPTPDPGAIVQIASETSARPAATGDRTASHSAPGAERGRVEGRVGVAPVGLEAPGPGSSVGIASPVPVPAPGAQASAPFDSMVMSAATPPGQLGGITGGAGGIAPTVASHVAPPGASGPPSSQVVPPVSLVLAGGPQGTHQMVLHLDPPELGRVEVKMQSGAEPGANVQVSVERPATLTLLQHDQAALHRALDQAGVPAEGRSLTLQLGGDWSGASADQGRGNAQDRSGLPAAVPAAEPDVASDPAPSPVLAPGRIARSLGLDITA